jgi:PAS domain S-box-containing protein
MKKYIFQWAAAFIISSFLPFYIADAAEKVSLQLRWDHQFQFAGYYAAKWESYYADAGFDVEIRSAITADGRILNAVQEVANGSANYGIGAADILIARDKGLPLVVLASIFKQSAAEFYAKQETGLNSPADLVRLRVARKVNDLIDIELQAMLLSEGIDPALVTPFPHQPGLEHLADGRIDVIPGYRTAFPYEAKQLRIPLKTLRPLNYGIDFYGDSLFTHKRLIESDPDSVARFLTASVKGWEYALKHPAEIADRISRELPRTAAIAGGNILEFNQFQAEGVKELTLYPIASLDHINPDRWRRMHGFLAKIGLVKGKFDAEEFIFDPVKLKMRQDEAFYNLLTVTFFSALVITILCLTWMGTLRRTVTLRTKELDQANQELKQENSERKQAESALTVEKQRAEQYLHLAGVMFIGLDIEGKVTIANRKACEILECRKEEIIGQDWFENFLPEPSRKKVRQIFQGLISRNIKPFEYYENSVLTKKGTEKIIAWYNTILQGDGGQIIGILGSGEDITERLQVQEALRNAYEASEEEVRRRTAELLSVNEQLKESEARLNEAQQIAHIGSFERDIITGDGYWSDEYYRLFGYEPGEVPCSYEIFKSHIHPDDREQVIAQIERAFANKKDYEFQFRYIRKNGEVRFGYAVGRIKQDVQEKSCISGILQDITERVMMEKELQEKQALLVHAGRLASLGEMATGVAHELNQPLSIIRLYAEGMKFALKKADQLLPRYEKNLQGIMENVDRAANIIEYMRRFARTTGDDYENISLLEPVNNALTFFKEQFRNHAIVLETDYADDLPKVFVNSQRFEQIVVNFLSNARYAVDEQGKKSPADYQKKITLRLFYDRIREAVVFEVKDNGIGMTPEEKDHCLDPFFTTKEVGEGTGLGLSIVHGIVREFKGELEMESEKSAGTIMRVVLSLPRFKGIFH